MWNIYRKIELGHFYLPSIANISIAIMSNQNAQTQETSTKCTVHRRVYYGYCIKSSAN